MAGKDALVPNTELVDEDNGIFAHLPQSVLSSRLTPRAAISLYLKSYIPPFRKALAVEAFHSILQNPPLHRKVTTKWIDGFLSGNSFTPHPSFSDAPFSPVTLGICEVDRDLELLLTLHQQWGGLGVVFLWKLQKCTSIGATIDRVTNFANLFERLGGISRNFFNNIVKKNRRLITETSYCISKMDSRLYASSFRDSTVIGDRADWSRNDDVFGGCAISIGDGLVDDILPTPTDPVVCELGEVVNPDAMKTYESIGTDRGECQISEFIRNIEIEGRADNDAGGVVYLRRKNRTEDGSGRAYSSWLSLQNCTRERRAISLEIAGMDIFELYHENAHPSALRHLLGAHVEGALANYRILGLFALTRRSGAPQYQITTDAAPIVQKRR